MIRFELPFNLPSLNVLLADRGRGRNGKRRGVKKARADLAWKVVIALGAQRPREPLARVKIRLERHAPRMLDPLENLPGSFKPLMDLLQPFSKRHPAGLGVILNDSSACVVVSEVVQFKGSPRTVVTIEEA